jgi:L-alanine-DL-glutamate epimerase-like enolase superfamily enzyme
MTTLLCARRHSWPLREPFAIARGISTRADVIIVELWRNGRGGRGEAAGLDYRGETPATMLEQIESIRREIEAGATRSDLLRLLPAGGARNAIDAALWDLEAKLGGTSVWHLTGVTPLPIATTVTIGIRSPDAVAARARELSEHRWIKLKVSADGVLPAVEAVRRNAPTARLVVDANQSWSLRALCELAPELERLRVDLIEQPLPAGGDESLTEYRGAVPLCADESFGDRSDVARLVGRYQFASIKLDKTGGLTTALDLAACARSAGLRLMVGCMLGSSLAMAPAMVLAQRCEVADLDGPLLQAVDCDHGIVYDRGLMTPPSALLWG